ncbi:two-component system histidine kinase PnpS [Tenuibacillus multivorans]|uniref:histidine kinase n=1 Tax=Tenuibacillus multivorans TaxID=237069 RepID=A0A1G9ZV07_9BACI|nr:ATP-binding protein [Tenuibacillus multivorans]GEL76838.1 PAS domain-containing sensor histidine kinase [Tenuibacillus multivorans]SDN24376.1 two-component system, OmpR family, phosphate regulon sensor histidine kinase PhoR [Tenuibacillus multivorans]
MKNLSDRKTLIVYILISITFIMVLGVLFIQVARHYVVQAYEEQLTYDAEYVSNHLYLNNSTDLLLQQMEEFSESFPIDLVLINRETREHLHTFTSLESVYLEDVMNQSIESGEIKLIDSRLIYPNHFDDQRSLIVISEQLPLRYINTTLWSVVISLAILVSIFIWGYGNRIYENYVTPIRQASKTATELAEGNYKARIQDAPYGIVSELSQSINTLARNLQYITSKYENQNDRLKTVVNNMDSGLLLINEKGITRLTNQAFLDHFSIDDQSFISEVYYDVISNQTLNDAIQEVVFMERKKQVTVETDSGHYFEVYLVPIKNDNRTWKGIVVVCHDITKIKQLENVRKDFVANVSHELRTPITSIQGFAETLLDGNQHDEQTVEKFLKIIEKETKRLNALIDDLLDLSSIEKDDLELTMSIFKVSKLMEEVQLVVGNQIAQKQINATINVQDDLEIYADYHRLYQLILNLYSNAIQYTPEGGNIHWNVFKDEDFITLQIRDSGIGIPEKDQSRIFERFYRVSRDRSRQTGGTGLGLSIVKHIAEAHEGTIEIESEVGEGTSITVSIPQPI